MVTNLPKEAQNLTSFAKKSSNFFLVANTICVRGSDVVLLCRQKRLVIISFISGEMGLKFDEKASKEKKLFSRTFFSQRAS